MARRAPKRDEELAKKKGVEDKCLDLYKDVEKGFENQRERTDSIKDNWELYNCQFSDKQVYNGRSQFSLPFIHDAVEAQVTRYANQLFPVSGRYVEVTTGEVDLPQATQALLETYVRRCKIRTVVVPALIRNAALEGTVQLYVSWGENRRDVVFRSKVQPTTDGLPNEAADPVDDFRKEKIIDAWPDVEVISDSDFLLLPAASNTIDEALDNGGSVTVLHRWSKAKVRKMIDDEDITKSEGETLIETMGAAEDGSRHADLAREQLDAAGVKDRGKTVVIYETWTRMKVEGECILVRAYFGGEKQVLSVKRCPFWNDKVPIIGAPMKKLAGVYKTPAPVSAVTDLQIYANDTINEGADTSHYSAMPIVMTDPIANPRVETMTLDIAAVWQVDPRSTEIVAFPELWSGALDRAMAIKDQIFQTLNVNPAMIPQGTGTRKRNQAELATEAQVDLLSTADIVSIIEESVLTPMIQRFAEYDHQFRDKAITIRTYGEMGLRANMEEVEPLQLNKRFEFRWFGLEAARNAAQMQQQISWLNVIKGVPPEQYQDYELDLSPVMVQGTENVFGPRIAPLILKKKSVMSVDPEIENEMLTLGFDVNVHFADDDIAHLQAHMPMLADPMSGPKVREHMMKHQKNMSAKADMQMPPMQQGGGPSGPGAPREGGQPGPSRGGQAPAGAIHRDNMPAAGIATFPRKM